MAQSDIATKSLVGGGGTPAAVDAGRRPPGAAAGHLAETAKSRNAGVLDQRGDPMMSEPSSSGGGGGNGNNDNGNSGRTGTGAGAAGLGIAIVAICLIGGVAANEYWNLLRPPRDFDPIVYKSRDGLCSVQPSRGTPHTAPIYFWMILRSVLPGS